MLSPEDIRSRTFLVSLRGYDREEVTAFLEQVAGDMAALRQQLEEAEAATQASAGEAPPEATTQIEAVGERAGAEQGPFAEIGAETQRILEAAQQAGEELRRRAQEDADRELNGAHAEAARAIADAERQRDEIAAAVSALEEARDQLAGDLREVGRGLERMLRDLAPAAETTTTMRAALAEAAWDEEPAGAPRPDDDEGEQEGEQPEAAPAPSAPASQGDRAAAEPVPAADAADEHEPAEAAHPVAASAPAMGASAPEAERVITLVPEPSRPSRRSAKGAAERVPVRARGDALAPSHPKVVRRLKRGLQNIENATLDHLRREEVRGDVEQFLPDENATAALAELVRQHVENAYAVGYHSGASALGQAADDPPHLERDLGAALAAEIIGALSDRLRVQLEAAATEHAEPSALAERVDRAFAAVRDRLVGEASAIALVRAYEWGQHDAWRAFGVERRKWALASEPSCDDPRCEDNAASGAVALGEPFPSGHNVPPARAGCSCTTVPLVFRP